MLIRWIQVQDTHLFNTKQRYNSWSQGEQGRAIQLTLLKYVSQKWGHRNREVGGWNKGEVLLKTCEELQRNVCAVLENLPEVEATILTVLQKHGVETKNNHYVRHWLMGVEVTEMKEKFCCW